MAQMRFGVYLLVVSAQLAGLDDPNISKDMLKSKQKVSHLN